MIVDVIMAVTVVTKSILSAADSHRYNNYRAVQSSDLAVTESTLIL